MTTGPTRRAALSAVLAIAVSAGLVPAGPAHPAEELAAPETELRGAVTSLPLPRFVSIRADSANARRGPGLDHRVDWAFVRRNLPVEVTAEYGNWRRVRDADGLGGWVHHTLLSGVRTGLVIGPAAVAVRADPDTEARVRALAEPGAVLRIEACHGGWCDVNAAGMSGWIEATALWGVRPGEEFD